MLHQPTNYKCRDHTGTAIWRCLNGGSGADIEVSKDAGMEEMGLQSAGQVKPSLLLPVAIQQPTFNSSESYPPRSCSESGRVKLEFNQRRPHLGGRTGQCEINRQSCASDREQGWYWRTSNSRWVEKVLVFFQKKNSSGVGSDSVWEKLKY